MKNERLSINDARALKQIRNSLMHTGIAPSIRDIMKALGYKSPHSAMLLVNHLMERGYLKRRKTDARLQLIEDPEADRSHARTVGIPVVGSAPCGQPMLAEENIETTVPVSVALAKPPHRYFLLRTTGDSMNEKGIQSGNFVLVRQQPDAENGQVVVALIDGEATIKELHKSEGAIVLIPRSSNPKHRPIVLHENFQIQGIVVNVLPNIDY
jgi:repressor LexA